MAQTKIEIDGERKTRKRRRVIAEPPGREFHTIPGSVPSLLAGVRTNGLRGTDNIMYPNEEVVAICQRLLDWIEEMRKPSVPTAPAQ